MTTPSRTTVLIPGALTASFDDNGRVRSVTFTPALAAFASGPEAVPYLVDGPALSGDPTDPDGTLWRGIQKFLSNTDSRIDWVE